MFNDAPSTKTGPIYEPRCNMYTENGEEGTKRKKILRGTIDNYFFNEERKR